MKKELTNISEKSLMELEDIVNEEMLTTEDVNNMLEHTDKGRAKQTIRNCVTVLQNDPVLKKAIKRNELSGRMDIVKEVPWERRNNSPTVTDTDENIYRKLQNHWIIEMGEMKATITAKNIEQIKSFLSRQKETYKVPYEVHPEDRPRQCVFCGTSNDLNFLPLDRTGNRRFAPVMTDMSKAEVHILDNEAESKAYIEQAWAEAMVLYRQGNVFLGFTKEIEEEAKRLQKEFMPEDTNAGIIQAFLDDYDDDYVCTKILFDEALHRTGEMKQWEGKEIANIMNNAIVGWKPHGTHRFGKEYGIQRSWKRMEDSVKKDKDGFMEVPEQLEIPFE